jgi:hypothetical protein
MAGQSTKLCDACHQRQPTCHLTLSEDQELATARVLREDAHKHMLEWLAKRRL